MRGTQKAALMDEDLDKFSRDELLADAGPPWPIFLRGCVRYRESLDRDLPNAPVATDEYK